MKTPYKTTDEVATAGQVEKRKEEGKKEGKRNEGRKEAGAVFLLGVCGVGLMNNREWTTQHYRPPRPPRINSPSRLPSCLTASSL